MQQEDVGLYFGYVTYLVVMPDPATPGSFGLSAEGTATTAAVNVQLAAHQMVRKMLAQFWVDKFQNSSYRLLPRAVLLGEDPDVAHLEMFSAPVQEERGDRALVHTI